MTCHFNSYAKYELNCWIVIELKSLFHETEQFNIHEKNVFPDLHDLGFLAVTWPFSSPSLTSFKDSASTFSFAIIILLRHSSTACLFCLRAGIHMLCNKTHDTGALVRAVRER